MTIPLPIARSHPDIENVIFSSYGNDSIALIWWAYQKGLKGVIVAHSDTGWSADWWAARVAKATAWTESLGFGVATIQVAV